MTNYCMHSGEAITSEDRDIVDALRSGACAPGAGCHPQWCACEWMLQAAEEIERLRAEVQKYKDKEAAIARMWHDPASQ